MNTRPLVVGHRGAMGHETENTVASVRKALELGVDMIEIDVFKIKSGEIVVFHDRLVNRLTNGKGPIEEYNLNDLKLLNLVGDHKIPELREVLDVMGDEARLNIELKGPGTTKDVDSIIQYYETNHGWPIGRFLISSFNWDELRAMRAINKDVPIAVLTEEDPLGALAVAKELAAEAINPYYELLTTTSANRIQTEGFKIYTWTVNEPASIKRMQKLGVDGIITNYPERVR